MNIGRLAPGHRGDGLLRIQAEQPIDDLASLGLQGSVSGREELVPIPANAPTAPTLDELRAEMEAIPGVAAADGLASVDLPPDSLGSGGVTIDRPVRVFAFDRRYHEHYPSIHLVEGASSARVGAAQRRGGRAWRCRRAERSSFGFPGRRTPLSCRSPAWSTCLARSPCSRAGRSAKLEDFLYVPDSVVVSPETFREEIVPAFDRRGRRSAA